jgi:hypothetical protein
VTKQDYVHIDDCDGQVFVEDVSSDAERRYYVTAYDPRNDWYMTPATDNPNATSVNRRPETRAMTYKSARDKFRRIVREIEAE